MDTLYLKTGIHGIAPPISVGGALEVRTNAAQQVSAVGRSAADKSTGAAPPPQKGAAASFRFFSFGHPLKSLWPGLGGGGSGGSANSKMYKGIALDDAVLVENGPGGGKGGENETRIRTSGQNGNWLLKILHVRSLWRDRVKQGQGSEKGEDAVNGQPNSNNEEDEEECDGCRIDDSERGVEFDRDSFSRLLKRVSLAEAKLYAQMSYLGSLAYSIPNIKPRNLLKYRGLRFVTSSVEQKELAMKAEKNQVSSEKQEAESKPEVEAEKEHKNHGYRISASSAYHIAATAASYLHSHTRVIPSLKSSKADGGEDSTDSGIGSDDTVNMMKSEIASLMATTDSVTAVVAAKEEVKQAVADDLKSTHSSPSEWFICDDDQSGTRFFVIQGSGSLASWKANLLFEPIQFEGFDVLVHRGIYEAAKGIYEQMLPEVHAHLKARGNHATFRFTGHSLGGSLSLLVNLMLQIRGEVPASALLPVITFGAPSIMCGGDHLLHKLGLPKCHVQAITMHRDIVPRAFSCNYPNHVAELLKAVNGNFRNHPCLNNQKLLYAPMGELLILQPEEKFSPQHPLLPSGSGLYILSRPLLLETSDAEKQLRSAQLIFLNSPHPLEILSDRSAYGSKGTIQRDHHMNSYLKSVWSVLRQEQNCFRKARREHRRELWWPLVQPQGINGGGIVVERPVASVKLGGFKFSGILQTGRESLKRFSRLVASQHMHLLVVLLFPARLILVGAYNVISF